MACDSRTSWVDNQTSFITKWFDSSKYKKTINIDGVMYGFAGLNAIYKLFLEYYTSKEKSEELLDAIVELAKKNKAQFMLMRYDGNDLKIFAYSPPNDLYKIPEIYKSSSDEPLETDSYAIGSGKHSKMYIQHQLNGNVMTPIHKIIFANKTELSKKKYKQLLKIVAEGNTLNEAQAVCLFQACNKKGGDLFTGGNVNMCNIATKADILEQVAIMDKMDQEAKAFDAVCSSPIDAVLEKEHLEQLGHSAVSKSKVILNENMSKLLDSMQTRFDASI